MVGRRVAHRFLTLSQIKARRSIRRQFPRGPAALPLAAPTKSVPFVERRARAKQMDRPA